MRKTLLLASMLMLVLTSCEKKSIDNYPSSIVGWWEFVSAIPDEEGDNDDYRWVVEFKSDGYYTHFDNIRNDGGYGQTLIMVQPYYDYWIENDLLCGKDMEDNYCTEWGYPECECNSECNKHDQCHYTKIKELTKKTLILEVHEHGDIIVYTFKRINEPTNIRYNKL